MIGSYVANLYFPNDKSMRLLNGSTGMQIGVAVEDRTLPASEKDGRKH